MICPECYNARDYNLCISCGTCSICCDCEGITMTPTEFIASLPHGESKAAALKVYNLMTPKTTNWTMVADNPANLPPVGTWVMARRNTRRYQAMWGTDNIWHYHDLDIALNPTRNTMTPTHWRPI